MARTFHTLADNELVVLLKNGAVGVIPTDTVYGLVAAAHQPEAVTRMYALKDRERKPGTTIAADIAQLAGLGIPEEVLAQAAKLWPNPVSVIMAPGANFAHIHQGRGDSPFRVVDNAVLRSLLEQVGPLVTTSANMPGSMPAGNVADAIGYFGDLVDFYVAGEELRNRPPSTIVRITPDGEMEIIRQGAVRL